MVYSSELKTVLYSLYGKVAQNTDYDLKDAYQTVMHFILGVAWIWETCSEGRII